MTTVLSPTVKQHFVDNNGNALFNGQLASFAAGTNTPLATYTDSTGSTPNTNPIILNARGECDLWLPPNVAYKLSLSDSLSNLIWTKDNIVNNQLLTLYAGVDTGGVNAYILNFPASFNAYADGIIVYWTPSNTNTGASTINVNGIGVVNIVNPNGTPLVAGEIIANQPAQLLFKSGAFQLITATTTVYGSFTPVWAGFSVAPATTPISYRRNGTTVTLIFNPVNGTSNSASFILSGLPSIITPVVAVAMSYPVTGLLDNGARIPGGLAAVTSGGTITFYKDGTQPAWTTSGAKGFADFVGLNYTI